MTLERDDAPGLLMTGGVVAGLGWYFLQPGRVARVVGVAHDIGNPAVVLVGWTAAICLLVVGTALWWWGPVRVSRAEAVWQLSGPDERGSVLTNRRRRAAVVTLIGCLVTATVVSVLDWSTAPVLLASGVGASMCIVVVCTAHQHRSSRRVSGTRHGYRSVGQLHRDVFAPDDGFIAATRMAAVTLDLGWLDTAHTVRWQLAHIGTRSRHLGVGRVRACLGADLRRLLRRRSDLALWAVFLAVIVAVPQTVYLTSIAPGIATVLAYRSGCAWAGGLRRLTEAPALRRALGGSDAELTAVYSVIPVAGVLLSCGVVALTWHLSLLAVLVVAAGSAVATIRRATRPGLPFDAPVYITGQGGATQPLLLLALVRGPAAMVLTAVVASVIG